MNIKATKEMVYETLRDCPEARNSDKELRRLIYTRYYNVTSDFLRILDSLPDPESIRRSRQKIQETDFKADEKVRKARKQQEKAVRDDLGYIPMGSEGQEYHKTTEELNKGFEDKLKQDKMFDIPVRSW